METDSYPSFSGAIVYKNGESYTNEEVGTTDSTTSGYTASVSSLSSDVEKGDTVTVNVNATHESDSTYAASEIVLTYDGRRI